MFVRYHVITLVTVALILTTVEAQKPTLPYLYFEVWNENGKLSPDQSGFITVANNERIRLRVCMKVKSVEDAFENLEIQALNQHPDYFKHRSPPNITIQVKQVTATKKDVPFRILSSGGGKNLTVYDVDATLDILEAKEIREKHIRELWHGCWNMWLKRTQAACHILWQTKMPLLNDPCPSTKKAISTTQSEFMKSQLAMRPRPPKTGEEY